MGLPHSMLGSHILVHAKLLQSCLTPCDHMDWSLPGSSVHAILQARIGVGCHVLLQGIFLTQGLNPCLLHLLHWQLGSLSLAPPGKPSCILSLYQFSISRDPVIWQSQNTHHILIHTHLPAEEGVTASSSDTMKSHLHARPWWNVPRWAFPRLQLGENRPSATRQKSQTHCWPAKCSSWKKKKRFEEAVTGLSTPGARSRLLNGPTTTFDHVTLSKAFPSSGLSTGVD